MPRYRIEVRPYGSNLILYMVRYYRPTHDGPYSESFDGRLTWALRKYAERKIEDEKARGHNRVHGRLTYRIIEEEAGA